MMLAPITKLYYAHSVGLAPPGQVYFAKAIG
jgi:hypothetical protein